MRVAFVEVQRAASFTLNLRGRVLLSPLTVVTLR